jgi:hypothetical protein
MEFSQIARASNRLNVALASTVIARVVQAHNKINARSNIKKRLKHTANLCRLAVNILGLFNNYLQNQVL